MLLHAVDAASRTTLARFFNRPRSASFPQLFALFTMRHHHTGVLSQPREMKRHSKIPIINRVIADHAVRLSSAVANSV